MACDKRQSSIPCPGIMALLGRPGGLVCNLPLETSGGSKRGPGCNFLSSYPSPTCIRAWSDLGTKAGLSQGHGSRFWESLSCASGLRLRSS